MSTTLGFDIAIEQTLQSVTALAEKRTSGPVVVAVAGGSCSGKSTFARALFERLGDSAVLLAQDDFQLGYDFPQRDESPFRWDDPDNFAPVEVEAVLRQLRANQAATVPEFSLKENRRVGSKVVEPAKIIIFEGLYTLHENFRSLTDFSVYLESPFYARFFRRVFRFTHEVTPDAEIPVRLMLERVYPAHSRFVTIQRDLASIRVEVPYSFEDESVAKYGNTGLSPVSSKACTAFAQELPDGLEVAVEQETQGGYSLSCSWKGNALIRATCSSTCFNQVKTMDWLSL